VHIIKLNVDLGRDNRCSLTSQVCTKSGGKYAKENTLLLAW